MANDSRARTAQGGFLDFAERLGAQEQRLPITSDPIGSVRLFAASPPNVRWVLANGQALSREEYPSLFDRIGVTYGPGDGSTTFNVPTLPDVGDVPYYIKT